MAAKTAARKAMEKAVSALHTALDSGTVASLPDAALIGLLGSAGGGETPAKEQAAAPVVTVVPFALEITVGKAKTRLANRAEAGAWIAKHGSKSDDSKSVTYGDRSPSFGQCKAVEAILRKAKTPATLAVVSL
jgi:hypothetical protein